MNYIYLRCSTPQQQFSEQLQIINKYLYDNNIADPDIKIIKEKVSGTIESSYRDLNKILKVLESGDVVYISELSRMCRDNFDTWAVVSIFSKSHARIIQCKDGEEIEGDTDVGKMKLFISAITAESEVKNLRIRTQAGVDAAKKKGIKFGASNKKYKQKKNVVGRLGGIGCKIAALKKINQHHSNHIICDLVKESDRSKECYSEILKRATKWGLIDERGNNYTLAKIKKVYKALNGFDEKIQELLEEREKFKAKLI